VLDYVELNEKGKEMKNANQPAMPLPLGSETSSGQDGLTKREHFAAMAMQGLCHATTNNGTWAHHASTMAHTAIEYADALLSELDK